MSWQTPSWARMGQGRFKTLQQLQLHVLLGMGSAGLNEICLEGKDPVPNYLFFGEQSELAGILNASTEAACGEPAGVHQV